MLAALHFLLTTLDLGIEGAAESLGIGELRRPQLVRITPEKAEQDGLIVRQPLQRMPERSSVNVKLP